LTPSNVTSKHTILSRHNFLTTYRLPRTTDFSLTLVCYQIFYITLHVFPIWDILTCSADIHHQSLNFFLNCPKFSIFLAANFFTEGNEFSDLYHKNTQIPTMWQSFTAIGRGSSEISWWNTGNYTNFK